MYKNASTRAFTLVELLVIIAIIAVLSAIILSALHEARQGARDKQRKIDLKNLQLSVELYKEANGSYPLNCDGVDAYRGVESGTLSCSTSGADFIAGLTPTFIAEVPSDPLSSDTTGYVYRSDGTSYKIMALQSVEQATISALGEDFARCPDVAACVGEPACDTSANRFTKTYAVSGGNNAYRCE